MTFFVSPGSALMSYNSLLFTKRKPGAADAALIVPRFRSRALGPAANMHEQIAVGPGRVGVLQQRNETAAIELHIWGMFAPGKFRQRGEQIDVRGKLIDVHPRLQHARPAPEGRYARTALV